VTRDELRSAGLSHAAILHRVETRRLQRVHRGVYLLGAAPPTPTARLLAAVMACRPGAIISHMSAADLWGMLDVHRADVEVTVVARNPRARSGIVIHRVATLSSADVRTRRGIPLTSPARTICDLAATEPTNVVERALNEAHVLGLADDHEIKQAMERASSSHGIRRLRRLLDQNPTVTRNDAERLMLQLIRGTSLPRPLTNMPLLGYNVDFLWPEQRLVVEFDGFAAHGHPQAFERDRRRDRQLIAAGYRVIHVTWRQLKDEPLGVIADIAQALAPAAA